MTHIEVKQTVTHTRTTGTETAPGYCSNLSRIVQIVILILITMNMGSASSVLGHP